MKRRFIVAVAGAAVVGGGVMAFVAFGGDDRSGSVELEPGPPTTIERTPASYRATYLVEDREATSTERVTVVRPFASRVEVYRGDDIDAEPLSVTVTDLGTLSIASGDGRPTALASPPQLAGSDLRFVSALGDALEAGDVELRERRRVAGRECQIHRTGGPVNAGDLDAYEPGTSTYADVCIDEAGLVLEELWVTDGDRRRRRVALSVTEDVPAEPSLFRIEGADVIPIEAGGGGFRRLAADSRTEGQFWEVDPPRGYEHRGRFVVVPPQPEAFAADELSSQRIALVTDVWVRGADVVVLDRGGNLGGEPVYSPGEGRVVTGLGAAGDGEVITSLRMDEVRILLETNEFLRIRGTIGVDALLAIARTLHAVDGDPALRCVSELLVVEPC